MVLIFDEIESSPVMETLWKTYQKNYSYAANVSWHIIMEFIRDLYQTAFSDKFKADFFIDDRNLGGLPDWGVIYEMVKEKKTFADIYSQNEEDTAPLKKKKRWFSF